MLNLEPDGCQGVHRISCSDQLAQTGPVPDGDRWPSYAKGRAVRQCLGTVLDEEWAHHGFCNRGLDKLSRQGSSQGSLAKL
jgi:hypothetical protein